MFLVSHILLIVLSNVLVQYPFVLHGVHTTYGALSYPFIFILSDLATRLYGRRYARTVVLKAMFPALLISYGLTVFSLHGEHASYLALRVAIASFAAYVAGQLFDISLFARFRRDGRWWLAPLCSNSLGNVFDTFCFFSIAFFHSPNPFMAQHWVEIALVDFAVKCVISIVVFIPAYGWLLQRLKE